MLVVGVGCDCLDIFFLMPISSFSFSLSLGDGSIYTEILSERVIKPKTINQHLATLHRFTEWLECLLFAGYYNVLKYWDT